MPILRRSRLVARKFLPRRLGRALLISLFAAAVAAAAYVAVHYPAWTLRRDFRAAQQALARRDFAAARAYFTPEAWQRGWLDGLEGALARRPRMSEEERQLLDQTLAQYAATLGGARLDVVTVRGSKAVATVRMPVRRGGFQPDVLQFVARWERGPGGWRLVGPEVTSQTATVVDRRPDEHPEDLPAVTWPIAPELPPPTFAIPPESPPAFACPPDMVAVPAGPTTRRYSGQRYLLAGQTDALESVAGYCIDRYEAARPDASATDPGRIADGLVVSRAGVLPWTGQTWDEAAQACARSGKRLCSGAEWQKAWGGPTGPLFPYGGAFDADACNTNRADDTARALAPTGSFPRCGGLYGVFDMCGNVSEWTDELWQPGAPDRVLRGGSFNLNPANDQWLYPFFGWGFAGYSQDITSIHHHAAGFLHPDDGFRCCADPPRW